jgi:aminoglycoside phosphotransferase (APT) family kinase protein
MSVDSLHAQLLHFFREHAASFGLNSRSLTVDYILNWGGFVNHSFRVSDGPQHFHVKLSNSEDGRAALARWQRLSPLLERYHAPPVLDWIELADAAGILTRFVDGTPPQLSATVLAAVLPVLQQLHRDDDLRTALDASGPITARQVFFQTYHERFTEDLQTIADTPPPFIDAPTLSWLLAEVEAIGAAVDDAPAFDDALDSPVHGDLWLNNLLWTDPAHWHILDWDDLRVGDPAVDVAMLTGPTANDLAPLKSFARASAHLTNPERERLHLLGRASLLDWVIDPLADWIDSDKAPAHEAAVKREKERIHRAALQLYRAQY